MSHSPKKPENPFGVNWGELFTKSFVQGFDTTWVLITEEIPALWKWVTNDGYRMVANAYAKVLGSTIPVWAKWLAIALLTIAVLAVIIVGFVPTLFVLILKAIAKVLKGKPNSHH